MGIRLQANCLDFLPSPMMIRAASCSDLLLVSPGLSRTDDLYICNPVTKQFAQLPPIPRLEDARVDGREENLAHCYLCRRVVPLLVVELLGCYDYYYYPVSTDPVLVSIFCSESGKWEIRNFRGLRPSEMWYDSISPEIITCNGILYWLEPSYNSERLVYLDLLEEKCGAIDIPSGHKSFARQIGIVHAGVGVHEIRLIQVNLQPKNIHLKVWRLNTNKIRNNNNNDEDEDDDSNWFLVHNKKLEWPKSLSGQWPFTGPFLHPTNDDFLFIVYGKSVIKYNLTDATHKKITELRELGYWSDVTPFVMVLSSTTSNLANSYL